MIAASKGREDIMKVLLKAGADPSKQYCEDDWCNSLTALDFVKANKGKPAKDMDCQLRMLLGKGGMPPGNPDACDPGFQESPE